MIGINEEILVKLIKLNNLNHTNTKTHTKKLDNSINELSRCFYGKDLNSIFYYLFEQKKSINKIPKVVKSYSDVLYGVKVAYNKQDKNISNNIR